MRKFVLVLFLLLIAWAFFPGFTIFQESEYSLKNLAPENYSYVEAEGCSSCKGEENQFMHRAVGVDRTSGVPVLDKRGWLSSVHSRSQSHGDRINTACARCHAPKAKGATRNKEEAKPIPKGTWQGVTCGACHPASLERSKRKSLVINYASGTDPTQTENYIFRNRSNGKEMNALCRFCHHESHDLLIEAMQNTVESGALRCIDCHMAAYAVTDQHVERFHNFKVAANIPNSCSGGIGRSMSCHDKGSREWFERKLPFVKGPRQEWSSD
ncbi:MAG: hypothetical protein JSV96_18120 [Candidatus Aminicenantes bacterium]|nr:MAG: hypothetical protein JSV96_18120 [Candidatus Aminicenantes bacterium]